MGGPLINVFMRVFFDVFRQTSHINFMPSLIIIFYLPLINVFLRVFFDVLQKIRVLIFVHQNRARYMVLEFL